MYVHMHMRHMSVNQRSHKKSFETLDLELLTVVSHNSFWKANLCPLEEEQFSLNVLPFQPMTTNLCFLFLNLIGPDDFCICPDSAPFLHLSNKGFVAFQHLDILLQSHHNYTIPVSNS